MDLLGATDRKAGPTMTPATPGEVAKVIAREPRRRTKGPPKPLPKLRRKYAEREIEKRERRRIPVVAGHKVEQDRSTKTAPTGPGDRDRNIVFATYTPNGVPANGGLIPPDPSGADSPGSVVLYTGNTYLMASVDNGGTF